MEKVSVIIPCFNRAKTIQNAINSVLGQTYKNYEIIVVDDGSTDNVEDLIYGFPFITYIKLPINKGQAVARNAGFEKATGSFIATLDSDDRWEPTFLEILVSFIRKNNLDFAFANWNQENKSGFYTSFLDTYFSKNHPWIDISQQYYCFTYQDLRYVYLYGCPSPSSSILFKREVIQTLWTPSMQIADDWCLLLDIVLSGSKNVGFVSNVLWTKHIGSNNVYDNRDDLEVTLYFNIFDINRLIRRYNNLVTKGELSQLKLKHMYGLIHYSFNLLRKKRALKLAVLFLRRALAISVTAFLQISFLQVYYFLKNRVRTIFV